MDCVSDLKKWQTSTHPDLAERTPEELFKPEFVEVYRTFHADLWKRVTIVHGTLRTLEQVEAFPFDFLYAPNEMEFWRLTYDNFSFAGCVMLHALIADNVSDALTLNRFKNEVAKADHWLDAELHRRFRDESKTRRFDDCINAIKDQVSALRNQRLAHRVVDANSGGFREVVARIPTAKLRELFDATHRLFGLLCFGSAYATLGGDYMPSTVGGQKCPTSLDRVLDAVLKDSPVIQQPERLGVHWPAIREHKPPEQLNALNALRRRIGLPEA